MIRLGVNVDHVATLRQIRGGTTSYPNLFQLVQEAVAGGAQQITVHLREDRRHIQEHDLALLARRSPVPLNLEMAATEKMRRMAVKYKPEWCCLVPEKRQELTTEGGLDVVGAFHRIKKTVWGLKKKGIHVSLFIEPSLAQVCASAEVGADAVEFHTGQWVLLKGKFRSKEWRRLVAAALEAKRLGMNVHAGHGLDYATAKLIRKLPHLEEVNIGHSLVCYALEFGLRGAVKRMSAVLRRGRK